MKKRMLSFLLAITCVIGIIPSVFASNNQNETTALVKQETPVTYKDCTTPSIEYDFRTMLDNALDHNILYVAENGQFEFSSEDKKMLIPSEYVEDFSYRIKLLNAGIAFGAINFSEDTRHLYALDMTEENIQLIKTNAAKMWENEEVVAQYRELAHTSDDVSPMASHSCSYGYLNVGKLTADNRASVERFYETFLAYEPDGNAGVATQGYWISMVMERGPWDYKRDSQIGPWDHVWCCSYWRLSNQHKTAEWLGNYNYGYTGSFLFSLPVLKAGSFAAAGFNPSDYSDWTAIEEGYKYSGGR